MPLLLFFFRRAEEQSKASQIAKKHEESCCYVTWRVGSSASASCRTDSIIILPLYGLRACGASGERCPLSARSRRKDGLMPMQQEARDRHTRVPEGRCEIRGPSGIINSCPGRDAASRQNVGSDSSEQREPWVLAGRSHHRDPVPTAYLSLSCTRNVRVSRVCQFNEMGTDMGFFYRTNPNLRIS